LGVWSARRLSAIAELKRRRVGSGDERALWACDPWDSAAAEIAAAMNISSLKASGQMRIATALRDHLPLVAEWFRRGDLSARVVGAVTWRTQFITDDAAWVVIDRAIAERAHRRGPLSEQRLVSAVDALVLEFDPCAVVAAKAVQRISSSVIARTSTG